MKTLLERIFDEVDRLDSEQEELESREVAERALEMDAELAELDAMSESEACAAYNVDSKAEARQYIMDYYRQTA